jgi:hypothetical protein
MKRIPYTTPADEFLFASIGRLTIAWAFIEIALDHMVFIIHHHIGGKDIEREMPWSLSRKVRYLRKCFNKLAPLAPYRDGAIALLGEVTQLSVMRQDIIHGVTTDHPEGATQIKMLRLIRGGDTYEHREISVSSLEILESAADANNLGNRLLKFALPLAKQFVPDKSNDPNSKLPR